MTCPMTDCTLQVDPERNGSSAKLSWQIDRLLFIEIGQSSKQIGCNQPLAFGRANRSKRSSFGSDRSSCSKYLMVFINPSRSCTLGSHASSPLAKLMSGQRCLGSSSGSGRRTIFDEDPVSSMTEFGKLPNRELDRVSQIHGSGDIVRRVHQSYQPIDKVVHIAERTGLVALAIDRNVFITKGLHDEVRYHPPIVWMHARPIGIEDARDLDRQTMLAPIIEE